MRPTLLTEAAIQSALVTLAYWQVEKAGSALTKTVSFKSYLAGIEFVNRLAAHAEAMNHHPDVIIIGWRKVTLKLTTHSAGGITELDMALAEKADHEAALGTL